MIDAAVVSDQVHPANFGAQLRTFHSRCHHCGGGLLSIRPSAYLCFCHLDLLVVAGRSLGPGEAWAKVADRAIDYVHCEWVMGVAVAVCPEPDVTIAALLRLNYVAALS